MSQQRSRGFTLVEVLIVVVIMAILAATIIPQFSDSTKDSKISSAKFNLHTLRSQIELYKSQHDGKLPSVTLVELTQKTNVNGVQGTGTGFIYGPYLREIPANPFNGLKNVATVSGLPAGKTTDSGWFFDTDAGQLFINDDTIPFNEQ